MRARLQVAAGLLAILMALTACRRSASQEGPAGVGAEPPWPRYLKDALRARLTVIYEPSRPGCRSCWAGVIPTLQRFREEFPSAQVLVALPTDFPSLPELEVGRRVASSAPPGPTQPVEQGWVAAFDQHGRRLLTRALLGGGTEGELLAAELLAAYSLTAPLAGASAGS